MARGRRSDHTRAELRDLVLIEGSKLLAETGFHGFSARELARRIGYSVDTVLNALGGSEGLLMAINTRSFDLWADRVERALATAGTDRLASLVGAYFDFASRNPNLWRAIHEHRLPEGAVIPDDQTAVRGRLTSIIAREVAAALPETARHGAGRLTRSLIAIVHGHCSMTVSGAMELMGEWNPAQLALERVHEAITFAGFQVDARLRSDRAAS